MSLSVCDYEPCEHLQATIRKLVIVPDGSKHFNLFVVAKGKPLKTFYLPLKYCPFCGSRIEQEWIETFLQSRTRKK